MSVNISVDSEIGKLNAVIIHTPGTEVENMTPANAERALYSDILNLNVASTEYNQLSGVLKRVSNTFEILDLLTETLKNSEARESLISSVSKNKINLRERLDILDPGELARQLVEGVPIARNNLTKYLSKEKFELRPLHNFFFTRDSAIVVNDSVLIGNMASWVRQREAEIMKTIFTYHPEIKAETFTFTSSGSDRKIENSIEGGDILVARKDILIVGNGCRTTTQGIDKMIDLACKYSTGRYYIIVQELPYTPESFIHLDMVFTLLDHDKFMAYEPLILKKNRFQTVMIEIDNNQVKSIRDHSNIAAALKSLGVDMEPVVCGGTRDQWVQEREQWHSGANFFSLAPGKLLGYSRNIHTLEELSNHGFEIIKAEDVIKGVSNPDDYKRCVIGIDGSELSRGGGGARCMTMPISREPFSL
jgi:arginine deiminase